MPRLFAVFSPRRPFGVQNGLADFLLSFFGCLTNWRTKKRSTTFFYRPSVDILVSKTKKGRQKVTELFLSFKRMQKKTPKGRRAIFVLRLFSNLFWTAKGRPCKKYGKKSWHLHSALLQVSTFLSFSHIKEY